MYEVSVAGRPVPQGSMTPYAKGHRVAGKFVPFTTRDGRLVLGVKASNELKLKAWRKVVTRAASCADRRPLAGELTGPVRVDLVFVFERPLTHFLVRKGGNVLRGDAAMWCDTISTGDIDKLTRAMLDALTDAHWWDDDSQVCELHAWARWGPANLATARVRVLSHDDLRAASEREATQLSIG